MGAGRLTIRSQIWEMKPQSRKKIASMIFGMGSRVGGSFLMLMSLILSKLSPVITEGGWRGRMQSFRRRQGRKSMHVYIHLLTMPTRDPRILRRKEELKAEKLRKKEEKVLAKKMQEEEAVRRAEEEKKRKEEEDKKAAEAASNQKKIKEREKKLLRKERTRLRTLAAPVLSKHLLDLTDDDVETLCSSLDKEQLKDLCDRMEGKEAIGSAKLLADCLNYDQKVKDKKEDDKNSKQNGSVAVDKKVSYSNEKKERPWTKEEIDLLRKGMQKYPKGTSRTWEVISDYNGSERSVEEILKGTKTVLLQKPDFAKAFDSFLEKRMPAPTIASPLSTREEVKGVSINDTVVKSSNPENLQESSNHSVSIDDNTATNGVTDQDSWSLVQEKALLQALKTFPKDTNQRWERVAAAVPGKTAAQYKKKITMMKENFRNNNVTADRSMNTAEESSSQNEETKSSTTSEAANGSSSVSDADAWSEVQEKALVQALKTFPKYTSQRWERISAAVPGKTVIQCKKKFASLKENFRNQRNAV